jgi:hypothetical protein
MSSQRGKRLELIPSCCSLTTLAPVITLLKPRDVVTNSELYKTGLIQITATKINALVCLVTLRHLPNP